ncbi:MAG: homoserine kinase [Nitrososphaerales archaeon]
MSVDKVAVKAPATSANLGPGFDIFGIALNEPYDLVTTTKTKESVVEVTVRGRFSEGIPEKVEENSAGLAAKSLLTHFNIKEGVRIEVEKGVKPGLGLGSSAASAAAAVYAINKLFNLNLSRRELIMFSAQGEKASAGSAHADNVSAALLGGFVIVKPHSYEAQSIEPPSNLALCVAVPEVKPPPKKTGVARSILPRSVSLIKAVHNTAMACWMVTSLIKGDVSEFGRAMEDLIVEPRRAKMVPGYSEVKRFALEAGAAGVVISGAGPTMLAVVDNKVAKPEDVAEAMRRGFKSAGLASHCFVTSAGKGASTI